MEEEERQEEPSGWEKFGAFVTRNILPTVIMPLFSAVILGLVTLWNADRDIRDSKTWQLNHAEYHKERGEENAKLQARNEATDEALRLELDKLMATVANQGFQQAANVANIQRLQLQQDKLGESITGLTSDVRIALEILKRLEDKENRRRSELLPGR